MANWNAKNIVPDRINSGPEKPVARKSGFNHSRIKILTCTRCARTGCVRIVTSLDMGIFIPNRIFIYAGEFADLFSILLGGGSERCPSESPCVRARSRVRGVCLFESDCCHMRISLARNR